MLGVCTAVFIAVLAAVIWALICLRSRSPSAARDLRVARAVRIRRGARERAAALRAACELPCERASLLVDGFRPAGPQRADRALRHDALYRHARRAHDVLARAPCGFRRGSRTLPRRSISARDGSAPWLRLLPPYSGRTG